MPVEFVIFDLDGTLVDTSEDITVSLNAALAPIGLGPLSIEETVSLVGEGLNRLVEKVLKPHDMMKYHSNVVETFLEHYGAHLSDRSRPYPGVKGTLQVLSDAGITMAVLSNKRESFSARLLENLGLLEYFLFVAGADTVPEKKPSPRAVEYALQKAGKRAADSLMVGDSNYDIMAARGAGVLTVAAAWGFRPRETLSDADFLIENMSDLIALVKEQA